ncbi:hypothetical protein [Bacillus mesophilum]|uniref:DUF4944 domain-containing protein n=1 Tax=Bacillus mesophilum TaxID=1071718 RepID=A0A7V7RK38_9BACI|nr:hypothetical protein [Bacillus mesophilum]KAB2331460.1 hypothetical protein F7732_16605 [Bacillus mesophilum]
MKRIHLIILTLAFILFVFLAYDFFKGRHISEHYVFEGSSENWKVTSTFTSKGEKNGQSRVIIEYIGNDTSLTSVNNWYLEGNGFGTGGGDQTLQEKKIIKTTDYYDFPHKHSDQQSFSIEWLDQQEEFTLYQNTTAE